MKLINLSQTLCFWKLKFLESSQTNLQADICTGDNHVVVLDDDVRAEPPLRVPLHVAVGVAEREIWLKYQKYPKLFKLMKPISTCIRW